MAYKYNPLIHQKFDYYEKYSGSAWTNVENTDIDTGTEDIDTFDPGTDGMAIWHCFISDGTNIRQETMIAAWDYSAGTVVFSDPATADIGDTSNLVLSVDMSGPSGNVRLRAIASSDNWTVKAARLLRV